MAKCFYCKRGFRPTKKGLANMLCKECREPILENVKVIKANLAAEKKAKRRNKK